MKVHYGRMLAVAIAALASVCSAKDLYWWGNGSITWELNGAAAFREATDSETSVKFENGANAIFDSDYFAQGSVQARICSSMNVGDLLFDLSRDFTVTNKYKISVQADSFTKKGAGTLYWKPSGDSNSQLTFTTTDGKVRIEEGKLVLQPGTQNISLGTIGNDTVDGTTFEVSGGAEFSVRMRNSLSSTCNTGKWGVNVVVHTNGVFSLSKEDAPATEIHNSVRSLTLDGGSLVINGSGYKQFGILGITEKLAFSGPSPYVLAANGTGSNQYLFFGTNKTVEVSVPDITGTSDPDVTFAAGYPMVRYFGWANPTHIRKTGDGTLVFKSPVLDDSASSHYFPADKSSINGDITVAEGTLSLMTNSCVYGGFKRTITVEDGATLHIGWHNPFHTNVTDAVGGAAAATPAHVATAIDVKKGGKLLLQRDRTILENGSVAFGPLSFEDAEFEYSDFYTGGSALGVIQFTDKVWFKKGTTGKPYCFYQTNKTFYASTPIKRSCVLLHGNPEICVEDITGDERADVVLAHNLIQYGSSPGGFVKTGAGTLRLGGDDAVTTGTGNYNVNNGIDSKFAGDIVVREGTLQVGPTNHLNYTGLFLGFTNLMTAAHRTITVEKDGTLYMPNRNVFYGSAALTNKPYNCTFVVQGTYRQDDQQFNILPNLTVDGGVLDLGGYGASNYGVLMVADTFKVTGTNPCAIPLPDGTVNNARSMFAINGYPETVFDVDNVTADGAPDLDIGRAIGKNAKADGVARVGFTKRGAGTLRLGGAAFARAGTAPVGCIPDGDVKVEAGTLLADADNLSDVSDILVSADAALGGTGTVAKATLASGAHLTVRTSSVKPLVVRDVLTLGETGTIDIVDDAKLGVEKIRGLPIFRCAAATAVDFSKWNVTVDGAPVERAEFKVRMAGDTLTCSYAKGFAIIFR